MKITSIWPRQTIELRSREKEKRSLFYTLRMITPVCKAIAGIDDYAVRAKVADAFVREFNDMWGLHTGTVNSLPKAVEEFRKFTREGL